MCNIDLYSVFLYPVSVHLLLQQKAHITNIHMLMADHCKAAESGRFHSVQASLHRLVGTCIHI